MDAEEIGRVQFFTGDIADLMAVKAAVAASGATQIVHLAALQVPMCRADPSSGARVNVVGTVNVFEAVRHAKNQVRGLSFASSVAAFGPDSLYPHKPVPDDAPLRPDTLYGIYKQANEHTARVYWQDWQIGSVGLRPHIVYGVGRDQGLTSDIAKSILAAAAERSFHINFDGPIALQYADDVAKTFIAAAGLEHRGAIVCNLRNDVIRVSDFVNALRAVAPEAQISFEKGRDLPFPADLDDSGLRSLLSGGPHREAGSGAPVSHTPLKTAVQRSLTLFRQLVAQNRVDLAQLEG